MGFLCGIEGSEAGLFGSKVSDHRHEWASALRSRHADRKVRCTSRLLAHQGVDVLRNEDRRFRAVELFPGPQNVLIEVISLPWPAFHPPLEVAESQPLIGDSAAVVGSRYLAGLAVTTTENPLPALVVGASMMGSDVLDAGSEHKSS